jgi:hypothetical protein
MKYFAASVPRSVRAARLGHLRTDAIVGTWYIQNPGGANQVFDVIMQEEAEFLRTKNYLASPPVNPSPERANANAPYMLKDVKLLEVPEQDANAKQTAVAHFRKEFKIT